MNNLTELNGLILSGFDALRGLEHVPGEYLSFRAALYRAQFNAFSAIDPGAAVPPLPLAPDTIAFDPSVLARVLAETAAVVETAGLKSRLEKLVKCGDRLVRVARAALSASDPAVIEQLSEETEVGAEDLGFFGRALAAPYAARLVAAAGPVPVLSPETSPCPGCGADPGLSVVRAEAGRFLVCSLCGMEWRFLRTRCPFCGADNALQTISEGKDAPRWIEHCSRCQSYLKVADPQRLRQAVIPLVEAVWTLYLDIIAEREGCRPNPPYVALR